MFPTEMKMNCFFCDGTIKAVRETRTWEEELSDSFMSYPRQNASTIAAPTEKGLVSLEFKPLYGGRLTLEIEKAEKEFQRIKRKWICEAETLVQQANAQLGLKYDAFKITGEGQLFKRAGSPAEDRAEAARTVYLDVGNQLSYKRELNVDWIEPAGYKSHIKCAKPRIPLATLGSSPHTRDQLMEDVNVLPTPFRKIYRRMENEVLEVVRTPVPESVISAALRKTQYA